MFHATIFTVRAVPSKPVLWKCLASLCHMSVLQLRSKNNVEPMMRYVVSNREVFASRWCFGLFLKPLCLLTVSLSVFTWEQEYRIPVFVSLHKKYVDALAQLKSVQATPKTSRAHMLWVDWWEHEVAELAYDADALHLADTEAGASHWVSCVWQQPVGS